VWRALLGAASATARRTEGGSPLARVRIDPHWHYHDLRAIVLENEHLRLVVLPETGAKIHALIDKKRDHDVLWHNPRLEPRRPVFGQNFDDWWSGGWDEVFPTCDVSTYQGETYPYLGELWSLPWTWEIAADGSEGVSLHLSRTTVIATARMERWISLASDAPVVRLRHRLTNVGVQPMDFVWGFHPCFAVEPGFRMDVPGRQAVIGHTATAPFGPVGATYRWPEAPGPDGPHDMRVVPPASRGWCEGHYVTDLEAGWVALTDPVREAGVGLVFPREIVPVVWCWMVYGGWRGHHHVALEPWTGWPHQLERAVAAGRHRTLAPGERLECETVAVLYHGVRSVSGIDGDGQVRG
jgi:galactose mutarotase-like enzyme